MRCPWSHSTGSAAIAGADPGERAMRASMPAADRRRPAGAEVGLAKVAIRMDEVDSAAGMAGKVSAAAD